MDSEANGKLVYSVEECAKLLSISKCLCYELIRQHRIPAIKLGERRLLVPRIALEKLLSEGQEQAEKCEVENDTR